MEVCFTCGKNLALVGRAHRCGEPAAVPMANTHADTANGAAPMANSTYRYRDAPMRREYMREYMRRRRQGAR